MVFLKTDDKAGRGVWGRGDKDRQRGMAPLRSGDRAILAHQKTEAVAFFVGERDQNDLFEGRGLRRQNRMNDISRGAVDCADKGNFEDQKLGQVQQPARDVAVSQKADGNGADGDGDQNQEL